MGSSWVGRRHEATFWALQHNWNDPSKHRDREEADLLVLVHLAEVGDTDCQVRKGSMSDDRSEVLLVQVHNNLECRAHDPFCQKSISRSRSDYCSTVCLTRRDL